MRCFGGGCFGGNAVDPGTADIGTPVQHECGQSSCTVQNTVPQGLWAGDATPSSPGAQSSSSRCAPIFVSGDDIRMQHPDQYSKDAMVNQQPKRHWQFMQKQPAAARTTAPTAHDLYPYIVQHGRGIMSLSTLQEGLQHFVLPGIGYIAYSMMHNGPELLNILTPVALGDPICDASQFGTIAAAFLQQHPKAMFMQVSASFAAVLQCLGMLVNSVGGETQLDLATYTFSGYAKRGLRSAIASAAKEGVTVQEVMAAPVTAQDIAAAAAVAHGSKSNSGSSGEWTALADEMRQVDEEWLQHKGKHAGRVWFINRQPLFAPEPGVVKLAARDGTGRLLGFIFFDAVYESGAVVGYYANVTRMRPDAHPGTLNLIISQFMDRIRSESQLSAPAKKLSMRRSQRKKLQLQQQAAAAAEHAGRAGSAPPAADAAVSSSSSSSSSGVRFVSLGLSPLHHLDDSRFQHSSTVRKLFELSYTHGSGYYPFQPLAAAKAKYGAGLHGGKYQDPAVKYEQVYLAHSHPKSAAAAVAMFDMAKLIGFWKNPADAAAALLSQKINRKVQLVKQRLDRKAPRSSSSTSKLTAATPGGAAAPARSAAGGKKCSTVTKLPLGTSGPATASTAAAAAAASTTATAGLAHGLLLTRTGTSLSGSVSECSLIGTAPAMSGAASGGLATSNNSSCSSGSC